MNPDRLHFEYSRCGVASFFPLEFAYISSTKVEVRSTVRDNDLAEFLVMEEIAAPAITRGCFDTNPQVFPIRVELRSKRVKSGIEKAMEFRKVESAIQLTLLSTQGIHGSPRSYGDTRQTQARSS